MSLPIHRAAIALGANLGEREQTIHAAIECLRAHPGIQTMRVSGLYRTKPIDAQGPDFCNAAAIVETTLEAKVLLDAMLEIEKQLGRTRSIRNAPRTIDLDLIAHDDCLMALPDLTLPHPRAHERAFVLIPLCEIDTTVMLGPAIEGPLRPAADWLSEIDPVLWQQVMPW